MDVNYNKSNVYVPLANIIESGVGYIRYSDGTQICYGSFTGVNSGLKYDQSNIDTVACASRIAFPASFTAIPAVTYSGVFSMIWQDNINGAEHSTAIPSYLSALSTNGFTVTVAPPFGVFTQLNQLHRIQISRGNYIAIGKWK